MNYEDLSYLIFSLTIKLTLSWFNLRYLMFNAFSYADLIELVIGYIKL